MPKPDHVKCENCIYFEPTRQIGDEGVCRRRPPSLDIYPILEALQAIFATTATSAHYPDEEIAEAIVRLDPDKDGNKHFPEVFDDTWCGEFRSEWPEKP